jgi:hypothetical protein
MHKIPKREWVLENPAWRNQRKNLNLNPNPRSLLASNEYLPFLEEPDAKE